MMSTTNIDELTKQADDMLDANQISKAQVIYERIVELDSQHADAWFMLGVIHGDTGKINNGIECLERSISLDPQAPDSYLNLGNLLYKRGDTEKALNYLRQAIKLDDNYPEAFMLLGNVCAQTNLFTEAIRYFQKTVDLWPDSMEAKLNLANALRADGQISNAVIHLESLQKQYPNHPEILATLADCLHNLHRHEDTEAVFKQLISTAPKDVRGYNGLAELFISQGRFNEAESACNKVLQIDYDNFQAHANLGTICQIKGLLDTSYNHFEKAVSLEPNNAAIQYKLAGSLLVLGEPELAEEHCCKAIQLDPNFIEAQSALASIYEQQGKYDKAWNIAQKLVKGNAENPHVLSTYAALAHRFDELPQAIELISSILNDPHLSKTTRSQNRHMLGELYNRAKDYDHAFEQFHLANNLKENTFDLQAHITRIDRIIAVFNEYFLSTTASASNKSTLPVFIVGMPRSGTSLVEQILASHPEVYGAGELREIMQFATKICSHSTPGIPYPDCLRSVTTDIFDSFANSYLESLVHLNNEATYITDKMPHNFLHIGLIQKLFPKARIIHIIRNPLDTCISIYFNAFSSGHSYAYDLEYLATYYKQYDRLMKHWGKVINLPILNVRYEDLVTDQEKWTRQMIEHIGLEWDEKCLNFHENKRNVATPSYDQVRQPMYNSSIERWRNYDKHLNILKSEFGIN